MKIKIDFNKFKEYITSKFNSNDNCCIDMFNCFNCFKSNRQDKHNNIKDITNDIDIHTSSTKKLNNLDDSDSVIVSNRAYIINDDSDKSIDLVKDELVKDELIKDELIKDGLKDYLVKDELSVKNKSPKRSVSESDIPKKTTEEHKRTLSETFIINNKLFNNMKEKQEKYNVIISNLNVIRKLKKYQKLCVNNNGLLSIEDSYFPALKRRITGNSKNNTIERVEATIRIAIQIKNNVPDIEKLFDEELVKGLDNLSLTYKDYPSHYERLNNLISTI